KAEVVGDVLQREPEVFAAQNDHQACSVGTGIDARLADPAWPQKPLGFIEADCARGHAAGCSEVTDRELLVGLRPYVCPRIGRCSNATRCHAPVRRCPSACFSSFSESFPISVLGSVSRNSIS